ncbi:MAG: hypothetical protein PHC53_03140 [Patescibacteria group bacterium]|nr:hypothetical protein [Patescibacteria group bacterium]
MVRSIFAKQDKAHLDSLTRAAAVFDKEPNTIFLQIWASQSLPSGWLKTLVFDLIHCDGRTVRCQVSAVGPGDFKIWCCLKPEDPTTDLHALFAIPGKDFSLTMQYLEVVTHEGTRKRLLNRTYSQPAKT